MADWYETAKKMKAKKLINSAQQQGLDFVSFMKEAARSGVSGDVDIQNYAVILQQNEKRQRAEGKQSGIKGAVGRALNEQTPVVGSQELMQRADAAATLPPEQYAQQIQGKPSVADTATPQTREQFYGALGRQDLPPEATFSDVEENPEFQFAKGQFPGVEDELARARLKVQQDAEARKKDQIGKNIENQELKAKIAKDRLNFDMLKLDVGSREAREGAAEKYRVDAADYDFKQNQKASELKKWKDIQKGMASGEEEMSDYTPEQVNAQIAELESIVEGLKVNAQEARKRASELAKQSVFEARTGKKPKPTAANPPEPAPAPSAAPGTAGAIQGYREKFNY